MTVYIEYVIIDNFVIDYLLLKATFATTGMSVKRWRLFVCSFIGAVIALLFPMIKAHQIIIVLLKLCAGILLTILSANYKTIKSYFTNSAIFFGYTFLTGGAIIGVFNLLGLNYSSEISIALIILPVYALLRLLYALLMYVYKRKDIASLTYNVTIGVFGKEISATGFMDTGNGLYDGDSPVIVCDKKFFSSLIDGQILKAKIKRITVRTVTGQTTYPAVKLDYLKIYLSDEPNIYNNVTLCVTNNNVGESYDFILHPALLEGNNENAFDIEKVS